MNLGLSEIIIALIPIIMISLPLVWAVKKSKKSKENIGLAWYYYYTFFRLPISTIVAMSYLIQSTEMVVKIIYVVLIIIQVTVIIGLKQRTIWGWNLNILLIVAECILFALSQGQTDMFFIYLWFAITLLVWFLPVLLQ